MRVFEKLVPGEEPSGGHVQNQEQIKAMVSFLRQERYPQGGRAGGKDSGRFKGGVNFRRVKMVKSCWQSH